MDQDLLFKASVGGMAVAAATTVPALAATWSQLRSRAPKDNFYEDDDGVATPETIAAFSNKPVKFTIAFLAATTAGLSISLSALTLLKSAQTDLSVSSWPSTVAWVSPYSRCSLSLLQPQMIPTFSLALIYLFLT